MSKARAFGALWAKAQDAGLRAAQETRPTPMIVQQHASPLNDASPVVQEWTVPGGVCGFAWIVIQPGTSSFARWAKKTHGAMRHWVVGAGYRGLSHWIGEHGQSMERKEAHAHAMAKVLREGLADLDPKVEVYAQSRMD